MLDIADADALVAHAYPMHKSHNRIEMIIDRLIEQNSHILFPATAVCEAVTVLQRKLQKPRSAQFLVEQVKSGIFPLLTVDREIVKEAIKLFNPKKDSPGNTLFDAIVATIAIQHQADAIFGFDRWYKEVGLRLAEDLFPRINVTN